jgi:hypothetical protein
VNLIERVRVGLTFERAVADIDSIAGDLRKVVREGGKIGVYSGPLQTDQLHEDQIGLVWDGSLIDEIIVGARKDTE